MVLGYQVLKTAAFTLCFDRCAHTVFAVFCTRTLKDVGTHSVWRLGRVPKNEPRLPSRSKRISLTPTQLKDFDVLLLFERAVTIIISL